MDLALLVPLLVALVAGGAVTFYTARPQKDSIIATASKTAVEVVNQAILRLEEENTLLRGRLRLLEDQVVVDTAALSDALHRIARLSDAIIALGGTVESDDELHAGDGE